MKKSNRDNLDAMYNIDEDNLSASYRKKIDGQFIAAYAAIKAWADSQSAGFEAVAKWQSETENKLKGYVDKTTLNTSIKSYIDGNAGKAAIVSAVTGSFVKIDTNTGITTTSDVISKISQEVSNGIAKLTLSVSNGEESSTIKLMNGNTTLASKTITLSGLVSFTDLTTKGATKINGENITTGMISAALVDTSDLVVENVYLKSDVVIGQKIKILESNSESTSGNIRVYLGLDKQVRDPITGKIYPDYLNLRARFVTFSLPTKSATLYFDTDEKQIVPTSNWNIGVNDDPFINIYVKKVRTLAGDVGGIYFADSRLFVNDYGELRFYNAKTGNTTTIVFD
jgi:hypothetical protein